MLFNSVPFIFVFLPIALVGFHVTAHLSHRGAAVWLMLASLAFYGYWRLSFLPMLVGSIAFNYTCSRLIYSAGKHPRMQSVLLAGSIAANLAALVYFKYLFSLFGFMRVHGIADVPFHDVILPLGISFFTFTQIGYLVDIKQGVAKDRDLLDYVLFVTFFPHLIAGPILHNREMMPQFADPAAYRTSGRNLSVGSAIFIIGLLKKTMLADPLTAGVAAGFAAPENMGAIAAWNAVAAYSLQLYFDFSGYSDMAIGLARMFNIRFPLNFNSPYKATTVIDYWQRFHMTLTRFITMYVYNPLALSITRRRVARGLDTSKRAVGTLPGFAQMVPVPTMITMALAGVWHGAGLQYLIFGLLHGGYITVNHATRVFFPSRKRPDRSRIAAVGAHAAKVLTVYLAALVAFVFFRSGSVANAIEMLGGMVGLHGATAAMSTLLLVRLVPLYLIVWCLPNTQQLLVDFDPALGKVQPGSIAWLRWRPDLLWAVAVSAGAVIAVISIDRPGEFLYFQF